MSDENERSVASAGSVADIIDRLLAAVKADAPIQRALVVSAAAEIERLRLAIRRIAEQDATLSVCEGEVTVTVDGTLTDAEREAVQLCCEWAMAADYRSLAATLRGLLDRHEGCPDREHTARNDGAMPARGGETGDDSPDRE